MSGRHGPAGGASAASRRLLRVVLRPLHLLILATLLGSLVAGLPMAAAQTLNDRLAARSQAVEKSGKKDRLLVQANELIYNRDDNTVSARGNVQLYYQGRVLQADKVTFDRKDNRVFAEGHAKLTEADGSVAYGDRFDLTGDFKSGFIDSLRADTAQNTHFSAARVERAEGETTVFNRGTYTACEPCRNDPSKPPTWQIKAKRIIHKNAEQTIYYEDATLELWGVPIAWIPYFSSPDPTVKKKTGILAPSYVIKSTVGVGVTVPFFWNIAPDYDLLIRPTYYTRQGMFLDSEWRQRFVNGSYNIRAAGIFQQDPSVFVGGPYGPGHNQFRGAIESNGLFYLNDKWKAGWNIALLSDRWFMQDYRLPSSSASANFFAEQASSAFLIGQSARGYFDLHGYYFEALGRNDLQAQQPIVAPVLDYNKTIDLDPKKTAGIGGQLEIDGNFTSLTRNLAAYQSTGALTSQSYDAAYGLYDVCQTYNRTDCLLRGIAGNYTRATLNLSWKRKFIDPLGSVWTPFAFAHLNGSMLNLNNDSSVTFTNNGNSSTISSANQTAFVGSQNQTFRGSVVPGVGAEWRYPILATSSWGTSVFEPIAQVIIRPNEPTNQALVNEDAQSLVFDDTNLFQWNKFSGYDRFEGGTRANYGAQYTMTFNNGASINALVGQSYQLAGINSYASPDAANIGLQSGLDTRASSYVTRLAFAPTSHIGFIAKTELDPTNFGLQRLDLMATGSYGPIDATVQYARYQAQPLIGFPVRREGLATSLKYKIDKNWYATGNVTFDMSRHLYNNVPAPGTGHAPLFSIAGLGFGAGYTDDCVTLDVRYSSVYEDTGTTTMPVRNQTVLLSLQLRTLGDTKINTGLSNIKYQDGVGALN